MPPAQVVTVRLTLVREVVEPHLCPAVFIGERDRGRFRAGSPAARSLERVDRHAFRAADLVVADTDTHARFLAELTGRDDIAVCFVGAEERLFTPGWEPTAPFTALFVGKLIPLQGVETILAAARAAPDVRFRIVGSGQLRMSGAETDCSSLEERITVVGWR